MLKTTRGTLIRMLNIVSKCPTEMLNEFQIYFTIIKGIEEESEITKKGRISYMIHILHNQWPHVDYLLSGKATLAE